MTRHDGAERACARTSAWRTRTRRLSLGAAAGVGAVLAIGLAAAPVAAENDGEAISTILKELGVEQAGSGAGGVFTEAQRQEIEAIVDLALARRGLLPPDGVGTVAETPGTGALLDAGQPHALLAVLARFGPAEEGATSAGAPFVTGQMDGVRYRLDYSDCATPVTCRDVMFSASFDDAGASLEFLNAWNREHRYGVAGKDEDGAVWFRMPVNLHGGVSEANWSDTVDWWRIAAFEFRDALYRQ